MVLRFTSTEATPIYDRTDFLTGIAYKTFYGAALDNGTFLLSETPINSDYDPIDPNKTGIYTKVHADDLPLNFIAKFDIPFTMEGDIIIEYQLDQNNPDPADRLTVSNLDWTIYHTNAADSDTQLATYEENTSNTVNSNSTFFRTKQIVLTIANTHFKAGESLKVKVDGDNTGSAGGGSTYLAHDGGNRTAFLPAGTPLPTGTSVTTAQLKVHIPFRPEE